jgi:hypothetical protein
MGSNCLVPAILNRGGLRKSSTPFDWLFAYPDEIKHSLDVDFEDWLDEQYLTIKPKFKNINEHNSSLMTEHSLYTETGRRLNEDAEDNFHAFYHFNLLDEDVRNSFNRKFNRFRFAVASTDTIVFVSNNDPEEMKLAGVHDYYKDRSASTIFVYLKEIPNDMDYAKLDTSSGYNIISFGYKEGTASEKVFGDLFKLGEKAFYGDENFISNNPEVDFVCIQICNLISSFSPDNNLTT